MTRVQLLCVDTSEVKKHCVVEANEQRVATETKKREAAKKVIGENAEVKLEEKKRTKFEGQHSFLLRSKLLLASGKLGNALHGCNFSSQLDSTTAVT